jgi:methionyl-tRNA formyltransferase
MNIVFMGTPEFAVPCLQALIEHGENIQAVFTQPDKPKGRGYKLAPPPVKELAQKHNITVHQPQSLKQGEDADKAYNILINLNPDLIIVVAYGKILPKRILDVPKKYCINVHASLLPKYRGAAPIQWSVLNGEKETGVTTMLMEEGLDTGDMILFEKTAIGDNETASELHDRLSIMGAELLIKTIEAVKLDIITPQKQDDSQFTYAPMLSKDMCPIDFSRPAQEIHNKIRGLSKFPCATALYNGKKLKIYKSVLSKHSYTASAPGTIVNEIDFTVMCGDGKAVTFTEVQTEGGKRMSTGDFLRGNRIKNGDVLN